MKETSYRIKVIMKDHPVGMMETVTFKLGKFVLAVISKDKRVNPPWCARYGHQDGWKNKNLRFKTKLDGINHVLECMGIDNRV